MKFCLLPALLLLATGALTQDGFDLFDALDDVEPTPPKPKEQPKPPANPDDGGLDLLDAFGPDEPEEKPKKPQPNPGNSDGFGFDLEDALNPDPNAKPDRPAVNPHKPSGGGGSFDDNDLFDVGDSGNYKPDGGGADQPQDPDLLWRQILKMLNCNMPEEIIMWMSNLKKILVPLLERLLELVRVMP
ncbi:CD99 molecule isoform X5 [Hippocampus comes]|uniref:CD99 molecule isoform X5 n=1 Tax=Hippocampus comes TaxID=109280 RepID=UPI00094EF1E4|nr:PREDICTED: CD99 antigen-like protein 2 isoform X5 [Hippocampus comes]